MSSWRVSGVSVGLFIWASLGQISTAVAVCFIFVNLNQPTRVPTQQGDEKYLSGVRHAPCKHNILG